MKYFKILTKHSKSKICIVILNHAQTICFIWVSNVKAFVKYKSSTRVSSFYSILDRIKTYNYRRKSIIQTPATQMVLFRLQRTLLSKSALRHNIYRNNKYSVDTVVVMHGNGLFLQVNMPHISGTITFKPNKSQLHPLSVYHVHRQVPGGIVRLDIISID